MNRLKSGSSGAAWLRGPFCITHHRLIASPSNMTPSPLEDVDTFESVQWEELPPTLSAKSSSNPLQSNVHSHDPSSSSATSTHDHTSALEFKGKGRETDATHGHSEADSGEGSKWDGWVEARIEDYKKEIVDGKESHVTFGIATRVSEPILALELDSSLGRGQASKQRSMVRRPNRGPAGGDVAFPWSPPVPLVELQAVSD